jgi:peptidyl-prolyl cis-trans isomerase C
MRTVVVSGVAIPESLLAQEVQNHPGVSETEARVAAGHALATKALLLHRTAELGLRPEPELDDDGREETAESALIRAVLEAEIDVVPPTEAECRRVYDAQRSRFRSPALYEAAHILIEPSDGGADALEAASRVAARAARELTAVPERFEALARAVSDCPSGVLGGSLGQLRAGDLVGEVETALMTLQPGEIAGEPVRSRFGWHILKLLRRIDGREMPFESVRERISLNLESRAWITAASRYVLALAEQASAKGVALSLDEQGAVADGSACLGDFLGDGEAASRLLPWLERADPGLFARVCERAAAAAITPANFVRAEAADFVGLADDERWTQLISAAQGAEDPALATLASILRSKLTPPRLAITVIHRRSSTERRPAETGDEAS